MPAPAPLLPINASTSDTGWIDLSWLAADVSFTLTGTWVGTIGLDVSNQPYVQGQARTDYVTPATYTANAGPLALPRNIGAYVRFRRVAWTSGEAHVGVCNGINSAGEVLAVVPEALKYGVNT